MREITIDGTLIDEESDCYVIAEVGNNHCGKVSKCKQLFNEAKHAGANAVKLQKRDNKTLYTEEMYNQPYINPNSYGATYGEHRDFLEFNKDEWLELQEHANEIGITLFATPFDIPSADFLAGLNMPAYKIASADITNIPLIRHVDSFGKPMIVSTGGANLIDIERAYKNITSDVAFLHCVACYPNLPADMNLFAIRGLLHRFEEHIIGFSDHYNGLMMSESAFSLGARIIEKHFTLDHTAKGTDHALSVEPYGLECLVKNLKRLKVAYGSSEKKRLPSEESAIGKMGKSIYPVHGMGVDEVITEDNVCLKSPATKDGLTPDMVYELVGKKTKEILIITKPITKEDIKWT